MMRLSHQAPNVTLSSNSSQDIIGGIQAQSPHRVHLSDTGYTEGQLLSFMRVPQRSAQAAVLAEAA
jgi:hypothetical protein